MSTLRYTAIRTMFELLWASQLPRLIRRLSSSRGVIFTLHRVLPDEPAAFSPNAILQVKPEFLAYTIARLRELGLDIVDIDEAVRRVEAVEPQRPFAVFTFDDAYRDNLEHALPILRRLQCPFTLYVPTALVDGAGEIWWQALEDIIAAQAIVMVADMGEIPCGSLAEKHAAYDRLYHHMRTMPEHDRVRLVRDLATRYGFDLAAHCRALIMDWPELQVFAAEPLCTLGAHTVHHYELAKLELDEARSEIKQSVRAIEARLGAAPRHLSYPIGGSASAGSREFALARDLGFRSAVTTRPGALYHHHAESLHALPRVSLNGYFQERRYVDVFATGAIFSRMPG
jgi:peptidoglycan/xylan/chitin deacetylase (PgdA/CDA1 family)